METQLLNAITSNISTLNDLYPNCMKKNILLFSKSNSQKEKSLSSPLKRNNLGHTYGTHCLKTLSKQSVTQ